MHSLVGGMDLRHGCFSVKMSAKTKELGPMGGRTPPLDPPMHYALAKIIFAGSLDIIEILTYGLAT